MDQNKSITTGITALDEALGERLAPGNLIGAIGIPGSGKTVLACQILRSGLQTLPSEQLLFISTEITDQEIWDRTLSASLSITYSDVDCESESMFRDRSGVLWPSLERYGTDGVIQAKGLHEQLSRIHFHPLQGVEVDLAKELATSLEKFENDLGGKQGLVVLDYLNRQSSELDSRIARKSMNQSMQTLREAADRGQLLIFVFAQAVPTTVGKRHLDLDDIAESKGLFNSADAFIGIGAEYGEDPQNDEEYTSSSLPSFRRSQTLNIIFPAGGRTGVRVPVTRSFEFQRFEDRKDAYDDPAGYLPFSRERFRELCTLSLKTCINVYLFLALYARCRKGDKALGTCWPSQETIAKSTGLSVKQVRTALTRLVENGLIEITKRAITDKYKISKWREHHSAEDAATVQNDYVRISRSLLSENSTQIFALPDLLRIWLFIIMGTQVFKHPKYWELRRGHIALDYDKIEHEISLKAEACEKLLTVLEQRGSIEKIEGERVKNLIRVVNWNRYQPDV